MRIKDAKFLLKARRTKYRSVKTTVGGQVFASKKEARRFSELLLLQKSGEISNLKTQVSFDLKVNGFLVCRYVCDFSYYRDGQQTIEDTKSEFTAKLPLYKLKKKLMFAVHGIRIVES